MKGWQEAEMRVDERMEVDEGGKSGKETTRVRKRPLTRLAVCPAFDVCFRPNQPETDALSHHPPYHLHPLTHNEEGIR